MQCLPLLPYIPTHCHPQPSPLSSESLNWLNLQNRTFWNSLVAELNVGVCPLNVQRGICIFPEEVSRKPQCQLPVSPFWANWSGRTCLIVSQLWIYFDAGKWGVKGESVGQKEDR